MKNKIVIIGGGISGLSLAYHLESMKAQDYVLLEAHDKAGGLCGSYNINGFTFDYGGHLLHLSSKYALKLIQKLLNKNVAIHKRKAFVYIYGKELPFPFQNNLYGLDDNIISECVKTALTAYKDKSTQNITLFKNWAAALYGEGICKHFMFPYNQKLWQTDLNEMTCAWCGEFIPKTTLEDIIKGAYSRRKKDFGYNAHFFYPKTGGCGALCEQLLKKTRNIKYNCEVTEINLKEKTVKINGADIFYDSLVSTMPLKNLGKITTGLTASIKKDFKDLKHNSVYALNIGVSAKTKDAHWYYFPEEKYPFYRVGIQSAFSASLTPENCSSFYIEFAAPAGKKPDFNKLEEQTLKYLLELGFIKEDIKILVKNWVEIPVAYVIYDTKYENARSNIIDYLKNNNIYTLGRYGSWEYSFMEKSLLDGAALAEKLIRK
ncbi:MAG: FAD-dependent oxidoreductase [Elusimicrobiota bacterium]|jgi:protoporphyrinogen oxidase|nr:FAD-dependent oxidoreductase [Elusimicrobiota bacterium]